MDIYTTLAYLIVLLAVIARLFASKGWDWKPIFYPDGHFQLNFIFIIITGFIAAIPVITTVIITPELVTLLYAYFTIFTAVYGTPAIIDKAITAVTPTPQIPENIA